MANADRPRGLEPSGDPIRVSKYVADTTLSPGELVKKTAAGKVEAAAAGAAGAIGVCLSYAAADGDTVLVADHPQQKFVVQADGADIDAQTDIGLNYNIVATAEDSTYKISRMELDSDTGATDSNLPLRLVDIDDRPDNALGANVDCIVMINNHQNSADAGSTGV